MELGAAVLRLLGCMAWAGHATLASLILVALVGAPHGEGAQQLLLGAVVASLVPTIVMMLHYERSRELHEEDRVLWRVFLLWGGPIASAAYLTQPDRRISRSPRARMLHSFLE